MKNREYISDEQCKSYIITRIIEETPCKENLLIICEWLFSKRGVKCYQTRKDIRFDYENTTTGMFFGIVCQKSSARLDLYIGKKNENDLPEYVKLNDNPSSGWANISGNNIKVLSLNQLKNLIAESFADRFGKKMVDSEELLLESYPLENGLACISKMSESSIAQINQDTIGRGDSIMSEVTKSFDDIEFEQTEEDDEELSGISSSKRRIFTDQGDPEIESLHGKHKRGKLVIQPEFQRHFVWDSQKASRLIESVLLDIPLPVVYLAEGNDGKEHVIDGQQRLTSFFSFIDGQLPDRKDFKLTGLKVFTELNRKSFREIGDELQDKIRYCKIRTITFKKESEKDLRFEIFERLNTGAVPLNDQELRNCTYRGRYNELLKELSADKDFMHILGLKAPEKRMKDVELVLRFAAFYHATYLKYKPPIKKFLNQDMEDYDDLSDNKTAELKAAFKNSVSIIKSLLDTYAFKRFHKGNSGNKNGYWEPKRFNAALYDMLMYSFSSMDKNQVYPHLDAIREALISLMTDDEFIELIEISTSAPQSVTKRFDKWRKTLQDIVGISPKEPRCFSSELKKELYDYNPTCLLCGQKITNIDDAAIDHIEQYWLGGKTIPENARLTHRFCNATRPRKEI